MKKRGQVIVAAVFVLVVGALLAMTAVLIFAGESISIAKNLNGIQALNVAEAGLRFTVVTSLAADSDWSNNADFGPKSLNPGTFSVHYTFQAQKSCTLEVTGTVNGVSRVIRTACRKSATTSSGLPDNFDYGVFVGPPGGGATLIVNGAAHIYGDFYYNGPISMQESGIQTDGTIYSQSISVSGGASYASWEAIPDVPMPVWDNSYYAAITREAMTATSETLYLGWGQTLDLNGRTVKYRNVTLDWGSTLNGPGTLCATGNPSGDGDIIVNYGEGVGRNIRFVAHRDFIFQGGSSFTNTFEAYCNRYLKILSNLNIPRGTLYSGWSGSTAIEINPAQIYQSVMLCPYGEFYFNGGQMIEGLIYANSLNNSTSGIIKGALVAYSSSTLGGSLIIIYDADLLPQSVPGLTAGGGSGSASFEASGWTEVY